MNFYRGIIAIGVRNWICGASDKVEKEIYKSDLSTLTFLINV